MRSASSAICSATICSISGSSELGEDDDLVDAVEQLAAQRADEVLAIEIAGQHDDRVAEVDRAALRVGHAAVVEDLQQDRRDVGVRLLDLIEQHDRIRPAADRLGELPRLVVTGISGRCAEQSRDRVRFGELGEIEPHQRVVGAEQRVRERAREFRLADAAGTDEQKAADRFARILESGARAAHGFGDARAPLASGR